MLDFYLSSEATITVEPGFHANNFWNAPPDNFARIDIRDVLSFDVNSLQTFFDIQVYDEQELPYYFEELNREYTEYGNTAFHSSIIFPGGGVDRDVVEFNVTDTRKYFYETRKYNIEPLQIEFESVTLADAVAEIRSDIFGFDVSGSIFAQQGFPNFRSVVILTTSTGVPILTNRHVWIQ
jgi:hypothetical protein